LYTDISNIFDKGFFYYDLYFVYDSDTKLALLYSFELKFCSQEMSCQTNKTPL